MELDIFDTMTESQKKYLSNYGWNFSKKACLMAIQGMKKENGSMLNIESKEAIYDVFKRNGVEILNDNGYNAVYAYYMSYADYYGISITDEKHLCLHVKCIIDDIDNKGGNVFRKWYCDCIKNGIAIEWSDLIE